MKKTIIIGLMIMSLFISGCGKDLSNTPTRQVEIYLNKYQTLDMSVLSDLDDIVNDVSFNGEQREKYRDIVKKNYQDLTYKIKDEIIDGDNAIVTVEIEVVDYTKVNNLVDLYLLNNPEEFKDENGEYDEEKFINYRLDQLKDAKDTVKYTLELDVHKENDKWVLNELDTTELSKINGTYNY